MAEAGESSHQTSPPPEDETPPPIKKKPLEIRISVFFDGTGNNRGNIQAREGSGNTAVYDRVRAQNADNPGAYGSFEAGYSNVSILEEQYQSTTECKIHQSFYIEGVATRDIRRVAERYESELKTDEAFRQTRAGHNQSPRQIDVQTDSNYGNAAALGSTGLYPKIDKAFNDIRNWFRSKVLDQEIDGEKITSRDYEITKFVVDIFGFSRGAATARHFAHHILEGTRNVLTISDYITPFAPPVPTVEHLEMMNLKDALEAYDISVTEDAIQIGFVGVFDTVSSYIVALTSDVKMLYLDEIKKARKVYHLAAAEEHRACFSLTNIKAAKNAGVGEEYFLPGVHSDIGGGYRDLGEEEERYDLMNDSKVAIAFYQLTRTGSLTMDYKAFIKLIESEGWYTTTDNDRWFTPQENAAEKGEMWLEKDRSGGIIFDDVALKVHRTQIAHDYRRIPLQLMAEAMEKEDFVFKGELKSNYSVPGELSSIEGRIRSYVGSAGNSSRADDWFTVQDPQLKELRHKHLHYSSRIDTGHWPRFKNKKRYRQAYDG